MWPCRTGVTVGEPSGVGTLAALLTCSATWHLWFQFSHLESRGEHSRHRLAVRIKRERACEAAGTSCGAE